MIDSMEEKPTNRKFPETRWSIILNLKKGSNKDREIALEEICNLYWFPLYAFARNKGYSPADSEDLTQDFLFNLLQRDDLINTDQSAGKLRSYLLKAFCNFLTNEWRKSNRQKRGGDKKIVSIQEMEAEHQYKSLPTNNNSPDELYDVSWAKNLITSVLEDLQKSYEKKGKEKIFKALLPYLTANEGPPYSDVAAKLGMTVAAIKTTVHRFRKDYRKQLQNKVADTLATGSDVDEEIRTLRDIMRRNNG